MSQNTPVRTPPRVTRRRVAVGAAWTVPAVAVAAPAPAMAASAQPTCPVDCIQAVAAVSATTGSNIRSNTGTVTIGAPNFSLLFTCSGLLSAGIATVTGAQLTMSGRVGALSTPTTYNATGLGVGVAAGAIGATAVLLSGAFTFPGVSFPNGIYAGALGLESSPVRPTSLCIDLSVPFSFAIGGTLTCNMKVCYTPTFASATAGSVTFGSSALPVVYATTWIFATQTNN